MAKLPRWLGDTMELVFSGMIRPVEVAEVSLLSADLKKVIMSGDFETFKYIPGTIIEFRVTKTEFRHYTLSYFDRQANRCEMLLYLHGKGIGSEWASGLVPGTSLKMMGPGGKIKYNFNHRHHVLFGDETSLSLFNSFKIAAEKQGDTLDCIAELDREHRHWPELINVPAIIVGKSMEQPAAGAVAALSHYPSSFWQAKAPETTFYLTGRAKSIQAVRKALVEKGVPMKNIQTEPYWAEGKSGL